jgi:UTP--glucose-1-phosphate uridylyltransferase
MYNSIKIRKAVIPAAGLGTRMLPLTKCVPKELLPVGKLPMMQYAIEEASAAGVDEIYVVINKKRKLILEDYFSNDNWQVSNIYDNTRELRNRANYCQIVFLEQEELLGVADAIQRCKRCIGDNPFFVLMPDNVFFARRPSLVDLQKCFAEYKKNVLGLIEVKKKEEANFYGNSGKVEVRALDENVYSISRLMDKAPATHESDEGVGIIRYCGRYILEPEFFSEVDKMHTGAGAEIDDVPVLQALVRRNRVLGVVLQGKLFDCGHWEGYWAAEQYWMENRGQWS